ncbi:MAG: twin-arginine translocase TatA/TatE family subunit [Chthonomonadaceae bacterium]|nr:twin-arginine translocase TatA/TatE family subunit [Chthonomonadaceae bacterium]
MTILANMTNPTVWIIVAIVVLVLFGGSKIPELMKGVGQGVKELKKGMNSDDDDELARDKKITLDKERLVQEEVEREVRARMGKAEVDNEVRARMNKT